MTDLSRLKVSLTKHGAHKAFHLLRDLNTSQVLASVWNKHNGIKIDLAQTRQNLSAFADGNLPGVWDRAKAISDDTLRQLVFIAIVFSHHKVIEAFQVGSLGVGTGEIIRGDVLDAKAFTNIKNDIIELDLPPGRPSIITRVLGVDSRRFGLGQARRALSPQVAQALGALLRVSCCPARNAA